MEERIHGGFVYRRSAPGQPWELVGPAPQQQQGVVLPANPTEQRRDTATADKATVEAELLRRTLDAEARAANAQATKAEVDAATGIQEQQTDAERRQRSALFADSTLNTVLTAVRNARRLAVQGGTGAESLLSGVPATTARALNTELEPIRANLGFDKLAEMRANSPTGAALGNVTERELALLQSVVASLDPGVELPVFLERLDRIERHFIGANLASQGIDPRSDEGRQAYKQLGYTGVFEGEEQRENSRLAGPNATQERHEYPSELQAIHTQYLRDNWGNIDPRDYARLRVELDNAAGFTPDLQSYISSVPGFNTFASQGGTPDALGPIPGPPREMGAIEQRINQAAQSPAGAFALNFSNALTGGVPSMLAGGQEQVELLREARPYSSGLGEFAGAAVGAVGAGALGAARPMLSEAAFNAMYGASQNPDNVLQGAAIGAGSSLIGSQIGRQIGEAFPSTFAPGAIRQADESAPTSQDLRDLATQQYRDVEARGVIASPEDTVKLSESTTSILQREGRITPKGELIDTDTPVTRAKKLIDDFAGEMMTPTQAQRVRSVLAEGMNDADPAQRRLASILTQSFDEWAAPTLPGVDEARKTASRYIQGDRIDSVIDRAGARASQVTQAGPEAALRTEFRALDRGITDGTEKFAPAVEEQIRRINRGTLFSNTMRGLGKLAPSSPMAATVGSGTGFGVGTAIGGPALGGATAAGVAGLGTLAKQADANSITRQAHQARLLALGADEYEAALAAAIEQARRRGGSAASGLFSTGVNRNTRQSNFPN